MEKIQFASRAAVLPDAWQSQVVGRPGGAQLKVLRMDGAAYPDEVHDFDEALIVLEGLMNLQLGEQVIPVAGGEAVVVPAGLAHAVAPGSHGVLLIVDR